MIPHGSHEHSFLLERDGIPVCFCGAVVNELYDVLVIDLGEFINKESE